MPPPVWTDSTPISTPNLTAMTAADTTEAATNAALPGTTPTWQDNQNRIRGALSQIVTGNFTTGMGALLTSAAQMLPLSQKGAANGVPSLDGNAHVQQREVYDATEAATNDTLGSASTLVSNLNRLRYILAQMQGGAWNAAIAMLPLAQKDAANGVPSLDGSSLLTIGEARGVRKVILTANTTNTPNLNSTTFTTFPWSFSNGFQITTHGGSIRCRLSATGLGTGGTLTMSFQVIINGVTYALGSVYLAAVGPAYSHSFPIETPALTAGTYTAALEYMISSSVNVSAPVGGIVLELEEVA